MTFIYNCCIAVGVLIPLISVIIGDIFGEIDTDMDIDLDTDMDTGGFLPFSITGACIAAAMFGVAGLFTLKTWHSEILALLISTPIFILTYIIIVKGIIAKLKKSTAFVNNTDYMIGQHVIVTVAIKAGGIGEVIGHDNTKSVITYLAKTADGSEVNCGEHVDVISHISCDGTTWLIVERHKNKKAQV